jgi:hypothetical protein
MSTYNFNNVTQPTSDDWPPYDHGIDVPRESTYKGTDPVIYPDEEKMYPYAASDPDASDDDRVAKLTVKQMDGLLNEVNRQFDTGAQRDTADGKLRMSLIPQEELKRVAQRYLDGAEKYGECNWMKGMPLSVYYDCAQRHLEAWWNGKSGEDHAAAVVWNLLCAMWTESNATKLDDRHKFPGGQKS